jgi:hypothetical protein
MSFRACENQQFRRTLRLLKHNVDIPSAKCLKGHLNHHGKDIRAEIKASLPSTVKVSIALDAWSSPNHLAFLAITAYYIDNNWEFREVLIGFEQIHGEHTGVVLSRIVEDVLEQFGIQDRLLAVTTDNASNNGTLTAELQAALAEASGIMSWDSEKMHLPCLAHVVQLSVRAFLDGIKAEAENETLSMATVTDDDVRKLRSMDKSFNKTLGLVSSLFSSQILR